MDALINFFALRPTFTFLGLRVVWCIYLFNMLVQCERWPGTPITLRQGARVIEDSRHLRLA